MKKIKTWIFIFILTILFPPLCFGERYVNQSIPIQVNDTIYFEDDVDSPSECPLKLNDAAVVSIRFIYLGVQDNQIVLKRIDHEWSADKGPKDRERIINVFLMNNQGKLNVQPTTDRLTATKLIITVVDNSYGIKVEEAD